MPPDKCSPHGWTLDKLEEFFAAKYDSLKNLLDEREDRTKERFTSMKVAVDAALASSDRAVTKAEIATEKRFEGVNEFRSALADQSATLLPRTEYTVQHNAIIERINTNSSAIVALQLAISQLNERLAGKKEGLTNLGAIVIGLFVAISAFCSCAAVVISIIYHGH